MYYITVETLIHEAFHIFFRALSLKYGIYFYIYSTCQVWEVTQQQ